MRNSKESSRPVTVFRNRGPLKDGNDSKLIVYESTWFSWSSRINFIPFRIFRGPLFRKPVTGQEPFCCLLQQTSSKILLSLIYIFYACFQCFYFCYLISNVSCQRSYQSLEDKRYTIIDRNIQLVSIIFVSSRNNQCFGWNKSKINKRRSGKNWFKLGRVLACLSFLWWEVFLREWEKITCTYSGP